MEIFIIRNMIKMANLIDMILYKFAIVAICVHMEANVRIIIIKS